MTRSPTFSQDTKVVMGCGFIALALAAVLFGLAALVKSCRSDGQTEGSATPKSFDDGEHDKPRDAEVGSGFKLEELTMTSAPVSGYWKEEDLALDDEQSWIGSTCVIARDGENLFLLTNRHCLGLESLATADDDGSPEVVGYRLQVHFPGNVIRPVKMFGLIRGNVDLAWLLVDGRGVTNTVDLKVPHEKLPPLKPGMEVVVVGSPIDLGLRGSHTFGRISALRPTVDDIGREVEFIQTDAAINHGNSGGPIFAKSKDRYFWIGVAVAKVDAADNLGLAICRDTLVGRDKPVWFTADPAGVTKLFYQGW